MNWTLADILVATGVALAAAITFTVWRFKGGAAHDHATNKLLKRFFEGKACAICKRPIPAVHLMDMKPGLLNPKTRETVSWDQIPNVDLSTALETHLPLCPECEVAESFRQRFPDRVVDGDRSLKDAHSA
jgi:hypothetical protein